MEKYFEIAFARYTTYLQNKAKINISGVFCKGGAENFIFY